MYGTYRTASAMLHSLLLCHPSLRTHTPPGQGSIRTHIRTYICTTYIVYSQLSSGKPQLDSTPIPPHHPPLHTHMQALTTCRTLFLLRLSSVSDVSSNSPDTTVISFPARFSTRRWERWLKPDTSEICIVTKDTRCTWLREMGHSYV